ncbi:hypothetical protein GJ200_19660 [Salmonella enterica subsp. enterica]|nr:hypothetical protein [Salmonella enterica subsp. enterica serovar Thompson]EDW0277266.1 hypothetical protein [Salmonella enterica subsp. enterica serovar Thompson]EDW1371462.1 hypothetical protein [Salmonella enterica subsp. enterica]EEM6164788.1 hypothetical protein [Salmonella enterica subsp. enterica serovar Brazzaville]EHI5881613.1 hypothetical protein [Salmonella enterica]
MENLIFFIEKFIVKNRQAHWLSLSSGKWEKFSSKIDKMGKHLNERCILIEKNVSKEFGALIDKKNIRHGFYFDRYLCNERFSPVTFEQMHDDSILVCPDTNVAFYFHHEGWMWYCCI